ncbi:hypothetical protein SLEP1_g50997 [Rubroshorea leprosula]|uniref:AtpF n=1 Tax=Rubroshorea leprosula TaxID=152421 RepID=A0AAV5M1V9_9ROSI|nr:hypothetical protein SLEP1_g50997 [Rubroshorea leprosula]
MIVLNFDLYVNHILGDLSASGYFFLFFILNFSLIFM